MRLRLQLAAMMFLEYAVWGAWTPILGATLTGRMNATGTQVGAVYAVLWLACIITPFIGGQLVDRLMPSQVFLGIAAVICTVSAWMMAHQQTFGGIIFWMWIWSLAYAPTLGITNSIAFYHLGRERGQANGDTHVVTDEARKLGTYGWIAAAAVFLGYIIVKSVFGGEWTPVQIQMATVIAIFVVTGAMIPLLLNDLRRGRASEVDEERSFSVVRTAGTIGWIVASLVLTAYLFSKPSVPNGTWAPFEELQLTAVFGALLAIVAFLLPNTPPAREAKDPWAFTKAFALFKTVPGFAVFMLISFFISTEFQFYYVFSGPFMEQGLGIKHELISLFKSIAQYAEIICLGLFTPLSLKYLGLRKTLVIGALAWPLRYFIFALQKPVWLVLASMSFHGIGYAFVFVTSFIYIDRVAPKDIRASAQSLFTLVSLGLGNWLGTLFSGWLKDHFTTFVADPKHPGQMIPGAVNWPMIFLVPALLTTVCGLAFWFSFREPAGAAEVEGGPELETAHA
jgi:MFS family permease